MQQPPLEEVPSAPHWVPARLAASWPIVIVCGILVVMCTQASSYRFLLCLQSLPPLRKPVEVPELPPLVDDSDPERKQVLLDGYKESLARIPCVFPAAFQPHACHGPP